MWLTRLGHRRSLTGSPRQQIGEIAKGFPEVEDVNLENLYVGIYTIDFKGPGNARGVYQMSDFTYEITFDDFDPDKEDYTYIKPTKCLQKCGARGFKYGPPCCFTWHVSCIATGFLQ